jgi:glutathione S-transferase
MPISCRLPFQTKAQRLTRTKQRGLVPAMRYSNGSFDEIILESGLVAQFLVDSHPSHLLPASDSSPTASLFRYRVNFFVDTYFSKVNTFLYSVIRATSEEEKQTKADEWVKAVEKEIEPLLHDASPFFGGSKEMTLAEVWLLSTHDLRATFT